MGNNIIEKFKSACKRLGLKNTWFVIFPIAIILPIAMYFEYTLAGLVLIVLGLYFAFKR